MSRAIALAVGAAVALALLGWFVIPTARRTFIHGVVTYDAVPSAPASLPASRPGAGLPPTPRTRVVLIDGLARDTAATLPAWTALCARGTELQVDVGFPTVSLAIEAALWSGLTQQQTGIVFRSDNPIDPPLVGIPSQIPGSIAIAENHGYIVRSLGFATTLPAAAPGHAAKDAEPDAWATAWHARAMDAVAGPAPLVFVHLLRVDVAGHKSGGDFAAYAAAARETGAILGELVAAAPDARWFALSDHAHLPTGGHGGEERFVRQVEGCIAGPDVPQQRAGLVHLVDVSRALADSTGAHLPPASLGRPLAAAIAAPLAADQAMPSLPRGRLALGAIAIAAALALTIAAARRRAWLYPWWWAVAIASLVVVRGAPTLSMPMVYQGSAELMRWSWLHALALAAIVLYVGATRVGLARALVATFALPVGVAAAAITACDGWGALAGAEVAPIVPYVTAWCSPLVAVVGQASLAAALAALAIAGRRAFDRRARPAPPRTAP